MGVQQQCKLALSLLAFFENITRKVVEETVRRNDSLPATEAIKLPQCVLPLKNNKE
jgi:hypothetical protein